MSDVTDAMVKVACETWNKSISPQDDPILWGNYEKSLMRAALQSALAAQQNSLSADSTRIAHLEFIINEIDGALCQYCNEASDPYDPPSQWDAGCEAAFKGLCDAYNLWHVTHAEISKISMQFFKSHEEQAMILRRIARSRYSTLERAVDAAKKATSDDPISSPSPLGGLSEEEVQTLWRASVSETEDDGHDGPVDRFYASAAFRFARAIEAETLRRQASRGEG